MLPEPCNRLFEGCHCPFFPYYDMKKINVAEKTDYVINLAVIFNINSDARHSTILEENFIIYNLS